MTNNRWIKGKVRWFDNVKGEGLVRDTQTNECYYVHYSAIESDKTIKELETNQPIIFQLAIDSHYTQVSKLIIAD
jgi:cold shock CspA family protein